MKAILEFNLPEETEEYQTAMDGAKHKFKLDDVWNEVFRPYRKHGYGTTHVTEVAAARLNELTEKEDVQEAIELLINIYQSVISEEP